MKKHARNLAIGQQVIVKGNTYTVLDTIRYAGVWLVEAVDANGENHLLHATRYEVAA